MDDIEFAGLSRDDLAGLALDGALKLAVKRVKSGEATAADLTFVLNAAKHLNIGQVPSPNNGAGQLQKAITEGLPFPTTGMTPQ